MRILKRILVLAIVAVAILAGWGVGSAELANYNLEEDLHELASAQSSFRFGNVAKSDDDLRQAVISRAMDEGIQLQPEQVTVEHSDSRPDAPLYLAAHYSVPVKVADYSFVLQFKAASADGPF